MPRSRLRHFLLTPLTTIGHSLKSAVVDRGRSSLFGHLFEDEFSECPFAAVSVFYLAKLLFVWQ